MHRDIKPENILVRDMSPKARLFLADFGSAIKLKDEDDKTCHMTGTKGYVAPEVIQGQPYSFLCDIWSLGCLLHELISGYIPFGHGDIFEQRWRVCEEPLDLTTDPYLNAISEPCKELLHKLLEKDPSNRPSIEEVLHFRWFNSDER